LHSLIQTASVPYEGNLETTISPFNPAELPNSSQLALYSTRSTKYQVMRSELLVAEWRTSIDYASLVSFASVPISHGKRRA
jgi:hypothetical protein